MALKLKVNGRKIMLRKVMTGKLMKSHRLSETSDETKVFMCQAQNAWHGNKKTVLASTFSSPPMGRDENVLKCLLLTAFNNNFDPYQKMSLTDVVALRNCN